MKKISITLFFVLAMSGFGFAQSRLPEFDKVKEIKLLESTRDDVKKIFAGYKHDDSDDGHHQQYFSTKNAEIEVTFSSGDCSDNSEYWNVSDWRAVKIKITPEDTIKVKDFNFSKFTKEIKNEDSPESYIYHDEKSGIVFEIDEGEIQEIILYPPKSNIGLLCNNEKTSDILSTEKRLVDSILEDETVCGLRNFPPNVTELNLSANEIIVGCDDGAKNKKCSPSTRKISLAVTAVDPEGDVLTYDYQISGGKIIGAGANVIWDLTGVKTGTYTVTAGTDDGVGVVGATITKTVTVKACSDCLVKNN